MALYGGYGGGYGYGGYGYGGGFAPTPGGFSPAKVGAIESSPATPFEKVSGKLSVQENGEKGSWIGAGSGLAGGAAAGAALGYKFGGAKKGPVALAGAAIGGVTGLLGGLFAGREISEAVATKHDAGDDGKFNGSRRDDFQLDRTYQGAF